MALSDEKYVSFTTYRRSGDAVSSPVWIVGLDDGRLAFWTASSSGKAKRLAHTAKVLLQPSDGRGKLKDGTSATSGTAVMISDGPDFHAASAKVRAKYGMMVHVTKLLGTLGHLFKRDFKYGDRVVMITLDQP